MVKYIEKPLKDGRICFMYKNIWGYNITIYFADLFTSEGTGVSKNKFTAFKKALKSYDKLLY